MTNIPLISLVVWLPPISRWLGFGTVLGLYLGRHQLKGEVYEKFLILIGSLSFLFWTFYMFLLSFIQYQIWSSNPVSSRLLTLPLKEAGDFSLFRDRFSYFSLYVFERYGLDFTLSLLVTFVFFLFLKSLAAYRPRFFDRGEIVLGSLLSFIVGLPISLVFIALSLLVVTSIAGLRFMKKIGQLTTLGLPFIVSAGLTLLFKGF